MTKAAKKLIHRDRMEDRIAARNKRRGPAVHYWRRRDKLSMEEAGARTRAANARNGVGSPARIR